MCVCGVKAVFEESHVVEYDGVNWSAERWQRSNQQRLRQGPVWRLREASQSLLVHQTQTEMPTKDLGSAGDKQGFIFLFGAIRQHPIRND